ncbi:nucleotidyltransferase family protein [Nocardioides sp. CER19]|uniref:nucleotidyltransferase family protein n=1 Tax=Nocardioides sp. CER19 TaxID=3038538 RepID=UPI00244884AF|nr:nucleotidyltransferase family protein [Nocardioides sp. CER19]MDH2413447.1 nucleotidyltransferase family protein [Nocardioides sp. CER19]
MTAHGLLLAAGAGSRMGTPKALVSDGDGHWLPRGVGALLDGGCAAVTVVLGAAVDEALPLLRAPDLLNRDTPENGSEGQVPVAAVVARDWAEGMSASLRAGLRALEGSDADVAVVHLVDLPDVGRDVVRRVLAAGSTGAGALARAAYGGVPGHPVLLGRDHWAPIAASITGDEGARDYLKTHDTRLVECGDLASGVDVDTRE